MSCKGNIYTSGEHMSRNVIIPYNPKLKERARELRKRMTLGEKIFWQAIRRRELKYEFHRQVPIDEFIVDFYCHELLLAIEIDGASHEPEAAKIRDAERQARLENWGISFLRFPDDAVINNIEEVLKTIETWIANAEQ